MNCKNRRGAVLLLALAVLLVLGVLGGSFYGMVASERAEAARRHAKSQAELSAYSALEFALHQMRNARKPWRSDLITHIAAQQSLQFELTSRQQGAYALLAVKGIAAWGTSFTAKEFQTRAGYLVHGLPSVTLLDPNASVSLAGKAIVEGDVALQRGRVERSTHYKMPAGPSARFTGSVHDESWAIWDSIAFYPDQTSSWLENNINSGGKNCIWDARDTLRGEHHCLTALLRGDSHCDSCQLFADSIRITGNASLHQALLGARFLRVEGKGQVDGQFLAMDTLEVDLQTQQSGNALFLVNGRKTGPSDYAGSLVIQRYHGKALVLFQGENWDASLPGIPVLIGERATLQGLILAHGNLDMKGTVLGAIVAWNLAFEESGTLWQGYLKDAAVREDTAAAYLVPDSWFLGGEATYETP